MIAVDPVPLDDGFMVDIPAESPESWSDIPQEATAGDDLPYTAQSHSDELMHKLPEMIKAASEDRLKYLDPGSAIEDVASGNTRNAASPKAPMRSDGAQLRQLDPPAGKSPPAEVTKHEGVTSGQPTPEEFIADRSDEGEEEGHLGDNLGLSATAFSGGLAEMVTVAAVGLLFSPVAAKAAEIGFKIAEVAQSINALLSDKPELIVPLTHVPGVRIEIRLPLGENLRSARLFVAPDMPSSQAAGFLRCPEGMMANRVMRSGHLSQSLSRAKFTLNPSSPAKGPVNPAVQLRDSAQTTLWSSLFPPVR